MLGSDDIYIIANINDPSEFDVYFSQDMNTDSAFAGVFDVSVYEQNVTGYIYNLNKIGYKNFVTDSYHDT